MKAQNNIIRSWRASEIKIKKDSKGIIWIINKKKKVKFPKELNYKNINLEEVEEVFNNLIIKKGKKTKSYSESEKEEILNNIILQIKEKNLSLRKIFDLNNPNKPVISRVTFYEWLNEREHIINQYARACEVRADNIFDEMLEIADCEDNDITEDAEGILRVNNDVIQRDRLRIDTRKWIISKMNPKKYGEKQNIDHTTAGEKIQFAPARILTKEEAKDLIKDLENEF